MPSTSSVIKRIVFHPNIDFVVEDQKCHRRLKNILDLKNKRRIMDRENQHFLDVITTQSQLRQVAYEYEQRNFFRVLLDTFFTEAGVVDPNQDFGPRAVPELTATEHKLTNLLALVAQLGGVGNMPTEAISVLTGIREFCLRERIYRPEQNELLRVVTPDRPGLGSSRRENQE